MHVAARRCSTPLPPIYRFYNITMETSTQQWRLIPCCATQHLQRLDSAVAQLAARKQEKSNSSISPEVRRRRQTTLPQPLSLTISGTNDYSRHSRHSNSKPPPTLAICLSMPAMFPGPRFLPLSLRWPRSRCWASRSDSTLVEDSYAASVLMICFLSVRQ